MAGGQEKIQTKIKEKGDKGKIGSKGTDILGEGTVLS
jgi:hypothetical protein